MLVCMESWAEYGSEKLLEILSSKTREVKPPLYSIGSAAEVANLSLSEEIRR